MYTVYNDSRRPARPRPIDDGRLYLCKLFSGGRVPPAPTPKIIIPSEFPYPQCPFTKTLFRSSGDVQGVLPGRVLMLKAKIRPKTTKSHRGTVHVKAPGQPEARTKKMFKGAWLPWGRGYRPPNFLWSHELDFWWYVAKMAKNSTFWQKMCWGKGTPCPYPRNNHTHRLPVPTLPIHYDTFTVLRWRLGQCMWKHLASPSLECKKNFKGGCYP